MSASVPDALTRGQTPAVAVGVDVYNGTITGEVAATLSSEAGAPNHAGPRVMQPLPFDTTQVTSKANRSDPRAGNPCHPLAAGAHPPAIAFSCKDHGTDAGEIAPTLRSMGHDGSHPNGGGQVAVAFDWQKGNDRNNPRPSTMNVTEEQTGTLAAQRVPAVAGGTSMAVRRITPTEAERLQGFPDGYTDVPYRGKPAADGNRYRALGNSMAIPVMAWIGSRIAAVEALTQSDLEAAA